MALFGRPTRQDEQRAEAYRRWLHERHPLAVASLVLGIVSLIEFGVLIVFGLAGIVLGIIALLQLRQDPQTPPRRMGHRLAWTGIALSFLSLIVAGLLYLHRWG